ncbi:MAG: hypothetical protein NPINA01_28690 [Nitrospinaceae bacterium]|nr:MAG: hypothetical protein NPINA01_28690 [Nitrospinaceae bacterium]
MSILAKNLRTIRKELKCTQSMMADILKVGFRTYVRYEAGERDAPVSVLVKISRLGNLSLEQLLTKEVARSLISPVKTLTKNSTPPEVRTVNFAAGQINLKKPSKQELLTVNAAEKKLLSIFRKMDPELQKNSLENIGKAPKKGKKAGATAGKKKVGRAKKTTKTKKAAKRVKSKAARPAKKTARRGR